MPADKSLEYILFQSIHLPFIVAHLHLCTELSDESKPWCPVRKHEPCPPLPTLLESVMSQILAVPEGALERKLQDSLLPPTISL